MSTEYDENVTRKLMKRLKKKKPDFYGGDIGEIIKQKPKPKTTNKIQLLPPITDFPHPEMIDPSLYETGFFESGKSLYNPLGWITEGAKKIFQGERDIADLAAQPAIALDKEIDKIPYIGHILRGIVDQIPGIILFGPAGLDVGEILTALNVIKTDIMTDVQSISDVKRYGNVDGIKFNLYKKLAGYFNLPENAFEEWYPDIVKTDVTKGVGEDRIKDFYAISSDKQYNPTAHEHWLAAKVAQLAYDVPGDRKDMLEEYTYDDDLSGSEIIVYKDSTGKILIGIRGTDVGTAKHIEADLAILTKTEGSNEHFQTTVKRVEKIINDHNIEYGTDGQIILSGHSLGGQIVNSVMAEPHISDSIYMASAFAPGSAPEWLDSIVPGENDPQEAIEASGHNVDHLYQYITSEGDILSRSKGQNIPGTIYNMPEELGHSPWKYWTGSGDTWWEETFPEAREVPEIPEPEAPEVEAPEAPADNV